MVVFMRGLGKRGKKKEYKERKEIITTEFGIMPRFSRSGIDMLKKKGEVQLEFTLYKVLIN